jgi:hypothetical protein
LAVLPTRNRRSFLIQEALNVPIIDRDARLLGLTLGLGDIVQQPICHGYANACICDDCTERQDLADKRAANVAELPARQPWEPKRAVA